ncbi:MAG: (2Fe-2S)-binding protein [Microvirga sp.]|nr:(2Fe-2S)-binding protein [Microvirga sp.]
MPGSSRGARCGSQEGEAEGDAHRAFAAALVPCNLGRQGKLIVKDWQGLQAAGEFDPTYLHLVVRKAAYLARYLNVPPARPPGEDGDRLDDLPDDVAGLRKALLEAFDRQRQIDAWPPAERAHRGSRGGAAP